MRCSQRVTFKRSGKLSLRGGVNIAGRPRKIVYKRFWRVFFSARASQCGDAQNAPRWQAAQTLQLWLGGSRFQSTTPRGIFNRGLDGSQRVQACQFRRPCGNSVGRTAHKSNHRRGRRGSRKGTIKQPSNNDVHHGQRGSWNGQPAGGLEHHPAGTSSNRRGGNQRGREQGAQVERGAFNQSGPGITQGKHCRK